MLGINRKWWAKRKMPFISNSVRHDFAVPELMHVEGGLVVFGKVERPFLRGRLLRSTFWSSLAVLKVANLYNLFQSANCPWFSSRIYLHKCSLRICWVFYGITKRKSRSVCCLFSGLVKSRQVWQVCWHLEVLEHRFTRCWRSLLGKSWQVLCPEIMTASIVRTVAKTDCTTQRLG